MVKQPSFKKIIGTDGVAMIGFVGSVSIIVLYALLVLTGEWQPADVGLTIFIMIFTLPFDLALMWRVWAINTIFQNGIETPAVIERINTHNGQGWIAYRYTFQGRAYRSGVFVVVNKAVKTLSPGEQVSVVVDQNNPKRALIRDLY